MREKWKERSFRYVTLVNRTDLVLSRHNYLRMHKHAFFWAFPISDTPFMHANALRFHDNEPVPSSLATNYTCYQKRHANKRGGIHR